MEQFASIEHRPFCGGANIHADKPRVCRRLRPVASKRVENGTLLPEFGVRSLEVGGLSRGAKEAGSTGSPRCRTGQGETHRH